MREEFWINWNNQVILKGNEETQTVTSHHNHSERKLRRRRRGDSLETFIQVHRSKVKGRERMRKCPGLIMLLEN